jgi:hypothetical protein
MNTRKVGRKLENIVCEMLKEIDPKSRLTNNSGAVSNDGDISSSMFKVECKKRNTKNVTISKNTWEKLCSQIPVGSQKIPLYILENIDNDKFVVLDIKDFMRMLKKLTIIN